MKQIIERQYVNISNDLTQANNINVGINLRFDADAVIVKHVIYNASDGASSVIQIYTSLTMDNILCSFPNSGSNNIPVFLQLDIPFILSSRFRQGVINFQYQTPPSTAPFYGPGPLVPIGANTGVVSLLLEFVKYESK